MMRDDRKIGVGLPRDVYMDQVGGSCIEPFRIIR